MKKILIVDDERWYVEPLIDRLSFEGYNVLYASSCDEALSIIKEQAEHIRLIVIDSFLPIGDKSTFLEKQFQSSKIIGLQLAKYISNNFKNISIIGYSQLNEDDIIMGFRKNGFQFISKLESDSFDMLCNYIKEEFTNDVPSRINPNIFIVHGHDEIMVLELKNYLQNTLKLGEPTILMEKPSHSKTIIEKFEKYAKNIDLVFVLMTPDDLVTVKKTKESYSQPRPNVIFELGYFLGRLKRTSGKVILLSKSPINILSDLSGIIYIDVSKGIKEAGESIRMEIENEK
jgi:predicted nucleotide-binding protein